jgi:hypothetical protein
LRNITFKDFIEPLNNESFIFT